MALSLVHGLVRRCGNTRDFCYFLSDCQNELRVRGSSQVLQIPRVSFHRARRFCTEKNEGDFSAFPLSEHLVQCLKKDGIQSLFPIQQKAFDPIFTGKDIIAKAQTGSGKTLAFLLPIFEKLLSQKRQQRGRGPAALIIEPTRELALQVQGVANKYASSLDCHAFYGAQSYIPQRHAIQEGIDVLVGTPGRLLDHLTSGALNLAELQFLVLDEADRMLDQGFGPAIEQILQFVSTGNVQYSLFSATFPPWARQISSRYLRDPVFIDLIGSRKTPAEVSHIAIGVQPESVISVIADLLAVHVKDRAIVFTETKTQANRLSESPILREDSRVLHSDIAQATRESTMRGFHEGRFRVLIATDVASRGLDIPNVDVVIIPFIPRDSDTYVHRAGRCGRAGKKGTCFLLYRQSEASDLRSFERTLGLKFDRQKPPSTQEVLQKTVEGVVSKVQEVPREVSETFTNYLKPLLPGQPEPTYTFISACVALLTGYQDKITTRSLLWHLDDHTTVSFEPVDGLPVRLISVYAFLNKARVSATGIMRLSATGNLALAEIPNSGLKALNEYAEQALSQRGAFKVSVVDALPELREYVRPGGEGEPSFGRSSERNKSFERSNFSPNFRRTGSRDDNRSFDSRRTSSRDDNRSFDRTSSRDDRRSFDKNSSFNERSSSSSSFSQNRNSFELRRRPPQQHSDDEDF